MNRDTIAGFARVDLGGSRLCDVALLFLVLLSCVPVALHRDALSFALRGAGMLVTALAVRRARRPNYLFSADEGLTGTERSTGGSPHGALLGVVHGAPWQRAPALLDTAVLGSVFRRGGLSPFQAVAAFSSSC